jgi:hypothetical protein
LAAKSLWDLELFERCECIKKEAVQYCKLVFAWNQLQFEK